MMRSADSNCSPASRPCGRNSQATCTGATSWKSWLLSKTKSCQTDWLALSSGVLSRIIGEALGHRPSWCGQITWNDYAAKRYDRVKAALQSLLRPASYADEEGSTPRGWTLDSDRIIVWEPQDAFGRRSFGWEDVPSTLIDSDTTQGNVTFLVRSEVEGFLGQRATRAGQVQRDQTTVWTLTELRNFQVDFKTQKCPVQLDGRDIPRPARSLLIYPTPIVGELTCGLFTNNHRSSNMWQVVAGEGLKCNECRHEIPAEARCISQMPPVLPDGFLRGKFDNFCIDCKDCEAAAADS